MPENSILIVDDDSHLRESLCEIFELEGFDCHGVATVAEGIALADKLAPAVVLTDLQLPDSSGFQLCQNIKKKAKDTVIIMMTGRFLSADEKTQGFQLGADEYLSKPFNMPELLAKIRQILSRRKKQ